VSKEHPAGFRQGDALVGTDEERTLEFIFKQSDLATDRGMADVKLFTRPRKTFKLRDSFKHL